MRGSQRPSRGSSARREDPAHYELEARFGRVGKDGFTCGVSRAQMDGILEIMQDSGHCVGEEEWSEEHDFIFTDNKGRSLRTRVVFDSNKMILEKKTIEKKVFGKVDAETRVDQGSAGKGGRDVRCMLKREQEVTDVPSATNTDYVRIKQRRRFLLKQGENVPSRWAFDFSMTWSGRTKTEAEMMQISQEPVFEIECELIDEKEYFHSKSDAHIAKSLLHKMHDLLDDERSVFFLFAA